ncbi:GNAT family N-acetyltransferase [Streptococcus ovuberis]|uniref:GNAT family N-acetyltransferase n=1 Tax=Streptococcus ovuberis TaxID=1936207 RepID=A0A7X6S022_9STRE|nr:GNAT family N-acetyltransferase [Streptococcus ovuberis]NKZ19758.1 GNAT family N-acetyltransferase [Streptococcus ovuberis]
MLTIRHARSTDLNQVIAIESANFSPAEAATPEVMEQRIALISDTFLIAEIAGEIAGYVEGPVIDQKTISDTLFHQTVANPRSGGYLAVTSLSIASEFKGQGVGTALLAALKDLAVAQERLGITLTCHDYLIAYYEMNGFKNLGLSQSTHGGGIWYDMLWENPENASKR